MDRTRTNLRTLVILFTAMWVAGGCATTLKPTNPTIAPDIGHHVSGVRFDADEVSFREPALPVSSGNIWKREVAVFTADTMNDLVDATPDAPAARTVVTFEMHGPSMVQIGTWKEMTVRMVTTLPDGRVVRSEPRSEYLDSNIEFVAQQFLVFGGPVLDVAAFVLTIYLFASGAFSFSSPTAPIFCGCLVGLAVVGLSLNLAQGLLQYFVAVLEERRWSDMYVEAMKVHAEDVRTTLRAPAPPVRVPVAPRKDALPSTTPPPSSAGNAPVGDAPPDDASTTERAKDAPPSAPLVPPPPPPLPDPADTVAPIDTAPDGPSSFRY